VVRQLLESYVPDLQDAQLPSLLDRAAAAAAPALGLAAAQPAVSATASIRFTACTWSSRAERRAGVSSSRSMTSADAIAHRWTSSASWAKGQEAACRGGAVVAPRGAWGTRGPVQALTGERGTVLFAAQPLNAEAARELMAQKLVPIWMMTW
jgi:hypothetical protein